MEWQTVAALFSRQRDPRHRPTQVNVERAQFSEPQAVEWAREIFMEAESKHVRAEAPSANGLIDQGGLNGTAMRRIATDTASQRKQAWGAFCEGRPIHLRLSYLHQYAPSVKDAFCKAIVPVFQDSFPYFYRTSFHLWITAGPHTYGRHCDETEGVLIQLAGAKKMRIWPRIPLETQPVVYDMNDINRCEADVSSANQYSLQRGDALSIPRNAPHEVEVRDCVQSISLSCSISRVVALVEVCRGLNRIAGKDAFGLALEHFPRVDKHSALFFDGERLAVTPAGGRHRMPIPLRRGLMPLLQPKTRALARALPSLLNQWWRELLAGSRRLPHCPPFYSAIFDRHGVPVRAHERAARFATPGLPA